MFKVGDFVVRRSDYLDKDWPEYCTNTHSGVVTDTTITSYQWFKVSTYNKWIPSHCYEVCTFTKYIKLCKKEDIG